MNKEISDLKLQLEILEDMIISYKPDTCAYGILSNLKDRKIELLQLKEQEVLYDGR